jgi:CRP/FNR family cyclic AMP-dependent transcriptional regulator
MDLRLNPLTDSPIPEGMATGLRGLAEAARKQRYDKGALIIEEHDAGNSMYILLRGRVKVFSLDEDGREITYGIYGAGDYFGEMALDGGARSASVMTLEPSECAVVHLTELTACLQRDPVFAMTLIKRIIARARAATAAARSMALDSAYERLARLFAEMADGKLGIEPVRLPDISHQELASRIGTSREMVSRLLKDLEKGGYVETGIRKIVLLKKLPMRW